MTSELPYSWARTILGDLCSVEYGKGLAKKDRDAGGTVGVYGSAGLVGRHSCPLVEEPVIIVGRKGNAGSVWLTDGPSWPIDTTYFLRPPKELSADFLALQLGSCDLVQKDSSTTIPSLRRPDLEATTVLVAPIQEQSRIVAAIEEHFSRLDSVEATQRRIIRQIDILKSSLLADAFRMNGDLPPGWQQKTIGEVAQVQLGRQRSPQHHSGPQMRPYLRSANVTWQGICLDDVKEMNFDDADFEIYKLEPGDLLLNEASGSPGEVGKPAIWDGEVENCCFQNTLLRLRPAEVDIRYLYWYCYASALSGRFGDAGRGVNIRHLGKRGLSAFPIPIAPSEEQGEIAVRLDQQFEQAKRLEQTAQVVLDRIAALRRAVLSEAFSGRLVPQDPNDKPASALLDRIAASRQST